VVCAPLIEETMRFLEYSLFDERRVTRRVV
jgi:hypothetical protein